MFPAHFYKVNKIVTITIFYSCIAKPIIFNPNSAVKVLKNRIVLIMRVNPDVWIVINGLLKPLITSRKSIPHLSNAEFGFKLNYKWMVSFFPSIAGIKLKNIGFHHFSLRNWYKWKPDLPIKLSLIFNTQDHIHSSQYYIY